MMLSKKRTLFLKKIADNASAINDGVFSKKYATQVFFSGRDEDFVTMEFKNSNLLIEIIIELNNHQYLLKGNEKITYRVFTVDRNVVQLLTEEHWTLLDSSGDNAIKVILHKLVNKADA